MPLLLLLLFTMGGTVFIAVFFRKYLERRYPESFVGFGPVDYLFFAVASMGPAVLFTLLLTEF